MRCPACNAKTLIFDTRENYSGTGHPMTIRKRRCIQCTATFQTTEVVNDDISVQEANHEDKAKEGKGKVGSGKSTSRGSYQKRSTTYARYAGDNSAVDK